MDWSNIYLKEIEKKGDINNYIKDKIKYRKPLIKLIIKYSKNKKIIEAGTGTGILSIYLASLYYNVTAIDIDKQMLILAEKICNNYNKENKPDFKIGDIFELPYNYNEFDVSFGNGVLEHFTDNEIIDTLSKQMYISKVVIFGIPTKYFNKNESMYGNERYMNNKKWRSLIKQAGGIILEEKHMHYLSVFERIKNVKKYFKPYPFRIFVLVKEK